MATAEQTTSGAGVRWDLVALTTEREQQIVAHFASAYPRLGETAVSELYARVADAAARPVDQPGAWQGDSHEGFERWLRLRVNAACLAEVGRPGLSKYVRAPDALDDLADQLGRTDEHLELETRDVWEHLAPKLHEQEARYLMALAVCDSAADAREHLGWSPRQWRRWQESCNSRLKQLHATGMLGVLPLPLLARIWATITPERVAVATATGGSAAGAGGTLFGGAGTAKLVTGVAAIAAAGAGVITAEQQREKPAKPRQAIVVQTTPAVSRTTVSTATPARTVQAASKSSTRTTSTKRPPLATRKTSTTDFKPAGRDAPKTRGGSSDFIPDGPTPIAKTYTPQAPASSSGGSSQDFATP